MKTGISAIMQQAQAMREKVEITKKELGEIEVTGQSGAGLVTIVMTCHYEVVKVNIDPSLLSSDIEILEDLIAAAFRDTAKKVETRTEEKMGGLAASINLSDLKSLF